MIGKTGLGTLLSTDVLFPSNKHSNDFPFLYYASFLFPFPLFPPFLLTSSILFFHRAEGTVACNHENTLCFPMMFFTPVNLV